MELCDFSVSPKLENGQAYTPDEIPENSFFCLEKERDRLPTPVFLLCEVLVSGRGNF